MGGFVRLRRVACNGTIGGRGAVRAVGEVCCSVGGGCAGAAEVLAEVVEVEEMVAVVVVVAGAAAAIPGAVAPAACASPYGEPTFSAGSAALAEDIPLVEAPRPLPGGRPTLRGVRPRGLTALPAVAMRFKTSGFGGW